VHDMVQRGAGAARSSTLATSISHLPGQERPCFALLGQQVRGCDSAASSRPSRLPARPFSAKTLNASFAAALL
jgi:hypothetical protein